MLRVSISLSLFRMFHFHFQVRLLSRILIWLSVLDFLAIILQIFLICRPLNAAWDPSAQGECANEAIAYIALEVVGFMIDLAILVAPFPIILKLQVRRRKKWTYIALYSLGAM